MPKSVKVDRIDTYKQLEKELAKTRAYRQLLELATKEPGVEKRLLNDSQEYFKIVDSIDQELESKGLSDFNVGQRSFTDRL